MGKIKYRDFEIKFKYNLKKTDNDSYTLHDQTDKCFFLENESNEDLKIWLTKIDRSECDTLNISMYDPEGNIKNSCFSFYHFCYEDNCHYRITIEHKEENTNFLYKILRHNNSEKHWNIIVEELESKDGCVSRVCNERGLNTRESKNIENLLENQSQSSRENIVEFVKNMKYTRVKIALENQSLF